MVLAAGLLMAACSGVGSPDKDETQGDEGGASSTATDDSGVEDESEVVDHLVLGTISKIASANPLDQSWSSYAFAGFDSLFGIRAGMDLQPLLATDWVMTTDTTYEIHLREDALFHDGSPVTAADVAFSFDLTRDEGYSQAQNLDTYMGAQVIDDRTVELQSTVPDPLFLQKVGQISIIPHAYWESVGAEGFNAAPIGAGPFKVTSFDPTNGVKFEAFEDYWGGEAPTDSIELRYYADPQAMQSAFESGQIHLAHGLDARSLPVLQDDDRFVVDTSFSGGTNLFQLNTTKPPFDNPALRAAANMAINQPEYIDVLTFGTSLVEDGQVTYEGILGYRDDITMPAYDPDGARALVDEHYNGEEVVIIGITAVIDLYEAVQGSLADVGFNVRIDALDVPVWLEQFRGGSDGNIFSRGINYTGIYDASRAYRWLAWSSKPFVDDPEWTALWDAQVSEMDETKRKELLEEATQYIYENDLLLFTYSLPSVNATVAGVEGVEWLNPAMNFNEITLRR